MRSIKDHIILKILHLLEDVCITVALVLILVLTTVNVVLRYVFLTGILWSEEFIGLCLLFVGIIGAAACVRDRLNTSLDSLVCKLPLNLQKAVYFFVNIIVVIMLGYFTYGGILFTKTVETQQTIILHWPMKIFYGLIPTGCFLCLVEQIVNMVDDVMRHECRFKTIEEQIAEQQALDDENQHLGKKGGE